MEGKAKWISLVRKLCPSGAESVSLEANQKAQSKAGRKRERLGLQRSVPRDLLPLTRLHPQSFHNHPKQRHHPENKHSKQEPVGGILHSNYKISVTFKPILCGFQ